MHSSMRIVRSNSQTPALKVLRVTSGKSAAPAIVTAKTKSAALTELVDAAVFFGSKGERIAGRVKRVDGDNLVVNLAVPSRTGLLIVTDSELTVKASDIEVTKALMQQKRVQSFEAGAALKLSTDEKAVTIFEQDKDGKNTTVVCDYLNVVIEGHASTFGTSEKRDRGGDYVMRGAWDHTLTEFRKNPVMLTNHDNTVEALAGSWAKVGIDGMGLGVQGNVSNAPGLRDIRFKLMEGHLKGLSIGGIWYYHEDGFGIEEIDLFEISLVGIPMNPDTLAHTRSLGEADCRKAFAKFWRTNSSLRDAA